MPVNKTWQNGDPLALADYQRWEDSGGLGWYQIATAAGVWTYASATTVNVPAGALNFYQPGDKVRYKQGGNWKYGVIWSVADTLLTIIGGSDFTIANASITDIYISRGDRPFGWPDWFNWAPTVSYSGGTTSPTTASVTVARCRFSGTKMDFYLLYAITAIGTCNRTSIQFTFPMPRSAATVIPFTLRFTVASPSAIWAYSDTLDKITVPVMPTGNGNIAIEGFIEI